MPKVHELALNESPQHNMDETEVQDIQEENGMDVYPREEICRPQRLFVIGVIL